MFALTGCKEESDGGDADGNKWELNVTVDATTDASDYADAANASGDGTVTKKRYFKEITSSSKVAAIETTIKVNTSNTLKTTNGVYSAVGYMFGYNKNSDNTSKRDFYLLGIKPTNGTNGVYYLEKYVGVDGKSSEATGWTKEKSMGTYSSYIDYGATTAKDDSPSDDETAIKTAPDTTTEVGYSIYTITITQETPGTYVVKLNGDTLATITDNTHTSTIDGEDYATGSVCAYVMAPEGTKVEATYAVDKSKKDEIIKGTYNVAGGSLNEFDSIVLE